MSMVLSNLLVNSTVSQSQHGWVERVKGLLQDLKSGTRRLDMDTNWHIYH
jgi:hypothetical protein